MAHTIFAMGFVQDPFYASGFWMGDPSFDALTPDKKKETLQNEIDDAFSLHGKVLDRINKKYGGLGDKLKAYLGPEYDSFVTMYYGVTALTDKASKVVDKVSSEDPAVLAALDSSDEQVIIQWFGAIKKLQTMLDKTPANPVSAAPAGNAPAAASVGAGPSTGTLALAAAGFLGLGVGIYALIRG
jgi:hypothetical protein